MSHGISITQTSLDGTVQTWSVDGQPTREEAQRICIEAAIEGGWTPPRWWQWWRWGDTRIIEDDEPK